MVTLSRILCPVDFSDASAVALRSALMLARWYGAEVTVCHVAQVTLPPAPFGAAPPALLTPAEQVEAGGHLASFVQAAAPEGVEVTSEMREGRVVEQILRMADAGPADLIVMGTHGRSGFEHLLVGSVTERVLRKARCPVLAVREGSAHLPTAPPAPFQRILCGMDFSPASFEALQLALSLAQESGGELVVLHVPDWPGHVSGLEVMGSKSGEYRQRLVESSRLRLQTAIPDSARSWCSIDERVAFGRAWEAILDQSSRADVDLIVIGAHGREGLTGQLIGGTADHVVREATCPVLVVHGEVRATSGSAHRRAAG